MNNEEIPEIGNWYKPLDGLLFKIITIDMVDDSIGIQYADDSIEEFNSDSWFGMEPELMDADDNLSYNFYEIDNTSSTATLLELVDKIE